MRVALLLIALGGICGCAGCERESTSHAGRTAHTATNSAAASEVRRAEPAGNELRKLVLDQLEQRGNYRRPSAEEIERAAKLFAETLSNDADTAELRSKWSEEGFDLESVDDGGESFWVLKERPDEKFGRGILVIRRSKFVPVMLQAPHSFFDRETDKIALGVFVRSPARVCYWNTAHRRVADLTKEEDSFLNALSTGFARRYPRGRIAQFHGFAQSPNGGRFDQKVDVIISQGTEKPSQSFLRLAVAMRRACEPFATAVFPLDLRRLGGTKNRQRQVVSGEGFHDFVHCEMSPGFRRALRDDFDLQSRVGRVLTHLELNPEIE